MNPPIRQLARGGTVALALLWCAAAARAQEPADSAGAAQPDSAGAAQHEAAAHHDHDAAQPAEEKSRGIPPAALTAEQIEVMVAGGAHLFPLLPHEPDGQPGSAVEGLALLGSAVDSLGARGKVELSEEESEALVAGLMKNAIRARYCGLNCAGAYGDAALTFHVPRIEGDEATVWVLTFWAIGQLPDRPPDRVLQRGDEIHLRREDGRWALTGHTKLREELRFIAGSDPVDSSPAGGSEPPRTATDPATTAP
jgi:hypothetical protein